MTETEPNKTSSVRIEGTKQTASQGEDSEKRSASVRHNSSGGRGAGGEHPHPPERGGEGPRGEEEPRREEEERKSSVRQ